MKSILAFFSFVSIVQVLHAGPFKIVASTTTLAGITKQLVPSSVQVESLAKGPQDPHYLDAKPSYIMELRNADVLISNGLELEIGWLPSLIKSAGNPKIMPGQKGHIVVGSFVDTLEKPSGAITKAMGDVHAFGNPHIHLDPTRVATIAEKLAEQLSQMLPQHSKDISLLHQTFQKELKQNMAGWSEKIKASGITSMVTYHRTLSYFLNHFGIDLVGTLEPKPGIPPTASHIAELTQAMKLKKTACILNEQFFSDSAAKKLSADLNIKYVRVGTEINAVPNTSNYIELIHQLVMAVVSCK